MSLYLAPIHSWLFNKIKLSEELERNIEEAFSNEFGDDVYKIFSEGLSKYGNFIEDKPLESMIDTSNIHGWLQDKVSKTEGRMAYFITNSIKTFGENVIPIALKVYENHGKKCGTEVSVSGDNENALSLFKNFNNYVLDGMPCDHVNSLKTKTEDLVEWETTTCIHKKYWDEVSGDINVFYNLREAFTTAFIKESNPNFIYRKSSDSHHQIVKY
ncbi:hypothetical protein [Clostridium hydrogeniformans]|uniref:hypothetical protein n=1 Tax=Clostridium hydrogeniformans TaxID=349933 RepID=UPI0004820BF4|nr:hypothetical protein [Clostridium hydrogeniformans]